MHRSFVRHARRPLTSDNVSQSPGMTDDRKLTPSSEDVRKWARLHSRLSWMIPITLTWLLQRLINAEVYYERRPWTMNSAQDNVRSLWLSVESGSSRFKLRVLRNPWFLMILAMLSPLNRSSYTFSAGCALDWLIRLIAERERVMWSPINTSGYCTDVGRFRWIVGLLIQLRRKKFCWECRDYEETVSE